MAATAKKETTTYEFVGKHQTTGDIMLEHRLGPDGQVTTQKVLVIPWNTRPGVWYKGMERPRKQTIYGCESKPMSHPKDDVRSKSGW